MRLGLKRLLWTYGHVQKSSHVSIWTRGPRRTLCASDQNYSPRLHTPLPYNQLRYNSVEIDLNSNLLHANDSSEFTTRLYVTLTNLREKRVNAVFLKVSTLFGHLIPLAAHCGFTLQSGRWPLWIGLHYEKKL